MRRLSYKSYKRAMVGLQNAFKRVRFPRESGIFTRLSKLRDFTTRWAHFLTVVASCNFDTRFPPLAKTFREHVREIIA